MYHVVPSVDPPFPHGMASAYIFAEELNMDQSRECALEAARRILNAGRTETPPATNSQLLLDLAEMIRQRMDGEKLLEENSRWFLFPACGTQLGRRWLTGHSV
jgi:hypothetical protein